MTVRASWHGKTFVVEFVVSPCFKYVLKIAGDKTVKSDALTFRQHSGRTGNRAADQDIDAQPFQSGNADREAFHFRHDAFHAVFQILPFIDDQQASGDIKNRCDPAIPYG